MLEGHRLEPVDADVDVVAVVTARYLEVLALWRTRADEHGIEVLVEQFLHALDAMVELQVDAKIEDVADLLVEHSRRQTELRDVGTHESAGRVQRLENRDLVAERGEVVGDGQ
jgi:nucleotide-binding universal stress UspA family protein